MPEPQVSKLTVPIAVDAAGDFVGYTDRECTGRVIGVVWTQGTLDAGTDVAITVEDTGQPILTLTNQAADAVFYPKALASWVGDGSGLFPWVEVPVIRDRIKVVVAQGGVSLAGSVLFLVGPL